MPSEEEIEKAKEIMNKFMNNEMQRDKLERDIRCGGWKIGDVYKLLELNPSTQTLLQYIDQLEQENNKLSKMTDEMAEDLVGITVLDIEKDKFIDLDDKEEVKQYFEKKAEKK